MSDLGFLDRWACKRWKRVVGIRRSYTGDIEIDGLYEVEDFLRNIGEPRKADKVMAARLMCKGVKWWGKTHVG